MNTNERATVLLRGGSVVDPEGIGEERVDLMIRDGVLEDWGADLRVGPDVTVVDIGDCRVSPGFVDMHVHLREPGQEHKETIETGARAAASGGFTRIACMPNTVPAIDTRGTVDFVHRKAAEAGHCGVHVIAAVTKGIAGDALNDLGELTEAGAVGFSDDGFPVRTPDMLRRAMEYAEAVGRPIISHAEEMALSAGGVMNEGARSLRLGLKGIPSEAETLGTIRDILIAGRTGCHVHICHVSTRGAVEAIRRGKADGVRVTGEATPHHFTLTEAEVEGYRTEAKMNPPLRTQDDVEAVIEGLRDGTLDAIATDHAPHTGEEKEAEFDRAPFGIIGLETALGLSVTRLLEPGHLSEAELVRRLAVGPRRILGIGGERFERGKVAELTVWNPSESWVVSREDIHSKSANTPFMGWELRGRARLTIFDGKVTFSREESVVSR